MSNAHPYLWDFDRSLCADNPLFLTFSVGIYQWLPKASGRGLKKSKTIRVNGYVVEPELVYRRAQQLCDQLNRESARVDNPPAWLQKKYAVPKPVDLVIDRDSGDLTDSQVKAARNQVMKRMLIPHGFINGGDGRFIRKQDDQIHLVGFEESSVEHGYRVNLGFHYAYLPGLCQNQRLATGDFHLEDCGLRAQIGDFLHDENEEWLPYGCDLDFLKSTFVAIALACLQVFEEVKKSWADARRWLSSSSLHPPQSWLFTNLEKFSFTIAEYYQ